MEKLFSKVAPPFYKPRINVQCIPNSKNSIYLNFLGSSSLHKVEPAYKIAQNNLKQIPKAIQKLMFIFLYQFTFEIEDT
jgi:hypothetical protein